MPGVSAMQQSAGGAGAGAAQDRRDHDAALGERWINYQRQLGTVFQDVKAGSLESAAETLLSLSNWLLTQVTDLGMLAPAGLTPPPPPPPSLGQAF